MGDGSEVVWPLHNLINFPHPHLLVDNSAHITIKPSVFLLQITEFNPCFDEPYDRIEVVYSSHPTKKQLLDVARKIEVKSPYEMVHTGWGDLTYDEYTSVRYEIIEMPLL